MTAVAGVDLAPQSTTVVVRDADTGAVLASGQAPHPAVAPPRSEQDPEAWWAAFEQAWAAAGTPEVDAIAVAGQPHGMVVLDDRGAVVRPAKLADDTESAPDAGWLLKQLPDGAAGWAAACGTVPVAALTITKLSWLHRSEPESWARLARVLLPHDWLTYRLTGAFTTDRGGASGTGYWSPASGEYRWDLLAIVDKDRDWSGAVPPVLGPVTAAGSWRGAVVGPGTGTTMATALALGLRPGDLAVAAGTVFAVSDAPVADASGTVAGFADATGRFLAVVHSPDGRPALEAIVPTTRVVSVPSDPALVATGAAVQAAAVLGGLDPVAVADAWATATGA